MKTFLNVKTKHQPKTKKELKDLIDDLSIKLWEIDTSLITDMKNLFSYSKRIDKSDFEGVQYWDVSNVTDMTSMFGFCKNFDQPLNNWNVSNVKNMSGMFFNCYVFNRPLSNWDISNVKNMDRMFAHCKKLNQSFRTWYIDTTKVDSDDMFMGCNIENFKKPIFI